MEVYLTKTVKGLRDALDKALLPPKAKKGKAPAHTPQEVLHIPFRHILYSLWGALQAA